MEEVTQLKSEGNDKFVQGDFAGASQLYSKCLEKNTADTEDAKALRVTVLSNRAACQLKQKLFDECITDCTDALKLDDKYVKAYFRRAQAYGELDKIDLAFTDLKKLLILEPSNTAAKQLMQRLKDRAIVLSSVQFQLMDKLKSNDITPEQRLKNLRQVLGAVNEDMSLCKTILREGGCQILWDLREEEPFAVMLLARISDDPTVAQALGSMIKAEELAAWATSEEADPKYAASSITLMWHMLQHKSETTTDEEATLCNVLIECIPSTKEMIAQSAMDACMRFCSTKSRAELFCLGGGMTSLYTTLSADKGSRQRVAVVLGRVLPALDNDDKVQEIALEFCRPGMKAADVHENTKGIAALNALFFANNELGMWVMEQPGMMDMVLEFAKSAPGSSQAVIVDVFAHMANTEDGRKILAGPVAEFLPVLVHSDDPGVRSGAAVTLTKLNAVDFDADSSKGMTVLSSVMTLLLPENTVEEKAKGVEAVSFVITDTDVKEMVCLSSNSEVMKLLCDLAKEPEASKQSFAFGLAYVFENLTMSEDDKKREKLREMEVTPEQWEQFEKITKSSTRKGKADPESNVHNRIQAIVSAGGVSALRSLATGEGASSRVLNSIARSLANIATVQSVRGTMIAQGAFKALLTLSNVDPNSADKALNRRCQDAAHAMAKILITTDPHLISDSQIMDAMTPIVRQVRFSDEELVVFESLMALTNLATVSQEAKEKLVSLKAIQAFEYAQFSENLLVRRAATEAMNNLIPTPEIFKWVALPEKMKIWLLFAEDYENDPDTSKVACGALANLCYDGEVGKTLVAGGGIEKLSTVLASGSIEHMHRVLVAFVGLASSTPEAVKVIKSHDQLMRVFNGLKDCGTEPIDAVAGEVLKVLANPPTPLVEKDAQEAPNEVPASAPSIEEVVDGPVEPEID